MTLNKDQNKFLVTSLINILLIMQQIVLKHESTSKCHDQNNFTLQSDFELGNENKISY